MGRVRIHFLAPEYIDEEILYRVEKRKLEGDQRINKTRYILEALEEKFAREDRKKRG